MELKQMIQNVINFKIYINFICNVMFSNCIKYKNIYEYFVD